MAVNVLSARFGALADSTRRTIFARFVTGEASLKELAKPFSISPQAVSKHLKVLERAGLITRGRDAPSRSCRISPGALKDIDDWLMRYRGPAGRTFRSSGLYVQQLQAKEKKHGPKR
jgi:DNA-binding transcriptional ArsR family regulator